MAEWSRKEHPELYKEQTEEKTQSCHCEVPLRDQEFVLNCNKCGLPIEGPVESISDIRIDGIPLEEFQKKKISAKDKELLDRYIRGWDVNVSPKNMQKVFNEYYPSAAAIAGNKSLQSLGIDLAFHLKNSDIIEGFKKRGVDITGNVSKKTLEDFRRILYTSYMEEGMSPYEVKKRIVGLFEETYKNRAMAIARTETAIVQSDVAHETYKRNHVKKKKWLAIMDARTRQSHRYANNQGAIPIDQKYYMGNGNYMRFPHDPSGPPEEVINCFIDRQVPIFTSKGKKKISSMRKGDKVLTHKGRFRRVTKILNYKSYRGKVVSLFVHRKKSKRITVTPNHRFLTKDGWKCAIDFVEGDKIAVMANRCKWCGTKIPYWNDYCNLSCRSKAVTYRQWSNPKHRKAISKKARQQMKKEYASGVRDPFAITKNARAAVFSKYGKYGYMGKSSIHRLGKCAIIKKYGNHLTMLKKFAFPALGKASWYGSKLERRVEAFLKEDSREYVKQFWVGKRRIDFYLPHEKLFVEVDGKAYHTNMQYERERDKEILFKYPDHKIAHVTFHTGKPLWQYFDLVALNHTGTLNCFAWIRISKIKVWKLSRGRRLYNFAVKDDESYIANGFVSHNCRCTELAIVDEDYQNDYPWTGR